MNSQDGYDHYSMILEWDSRSDIYIATVPELPGCRSHGATLEEAVKNGREAMELWVDSAREDGDSVPPARYFMPRLTTHLVEEPVGIG